MKKYFELLAVLVVTIIPINIYAYELSCDNTIHQVGDIFSCKISGDNKTYDKLSGTITSDDTLNCTRSNVSPGLNILTDSTESYFNLSGTPTSGELLFITCKVIKNPASLSNATVSVSDFTYHEAGSSQDERKEILKSDYIKIEHTDNEGPVDTKPRDISDPSLRPRKLTSNELNITFSQFITEYSVEVLFDVEEVHFDYELNDPTSSLRIEGSTKLQVGNNIIDVYITNADSSKEACYTFNVLRLARGEEIYYPESDSTLKSMVVPGYSIGFDVNKYDYKIHLTNKVSSININTVPNYEKATVSISETDNLKNGDVIVVEVTSADETSRTTYKINITKDAPKKDYSTLIIVVVLGITFIGTIVMFILTSEKNKKDPLLSIKTSKRKVNKGSKFDATSVPTTDANPNGGVEDINPLTSSNTPMQQEGINQTNEVNQANIVNTNQNVNEAVNSNEVNKSISADVQNINVEHTQVEQPVNQVPNNELNSNQPQKSLQSVNQTSNINLQIQQNNVNSVDNNQNISQ